MTPKVLVVEDDQNYAELILRGLQDFAREIKVARRWFDALLLVKSKPDIIWLDLRLLDINLAEEIHLIEKLHFENPEIVIVVVSGFLDDDLRDKLRKAGCSLVSTKEKNITPHQITSLALLSLMSANRDGNQAALKFIEPGLVLMRNRFPELPTPELK